jgi:hypothetical protein
VREIEDMFRSIKSIEGLSMVFDMLREKFGSHEDRGDENVIQMIFNRLQREFPDPSKADMRDVVGFFMDMLRDIAPELGSMERQMIKDRLSEAQNIDQFVNMVQELEKEFDSGHHSDDHGPGGMGGMEDLFDPERANQEMLAAIPELMQQVMNTA